MASKNEISKPLTTSPLITEDGPGELEFKGHTNRVQLSSASTSLIDQDRDAAQLEPRMSYLSIMALITLIGSIQFGYSLVYFGPCIELMTKQIGWSSSQSDLYAAIITGMPAIGLAFGSFAALPITKALGYRKSLILANVIGLASVGGSLIEKIVFICVGRFFFGLSIGILQVAGTSFLIETVPSKLMGIFGPLINVNINTGILLGTFMGLIIPHDSSSSDFLTSQSWRYVFAAPWVLQVTQILLLLTVVRHDSINLAKLYASHSQPHFIDDEDTADATKVQDTYYRKIGTIYQTKDIPREVIDKFMNTLFERQDVTAEKNELAQEDVSNVTLRQALCLKKYRRATFMALMLGAMFQFGGVNLIVSYIFPFLAQTQLSINLGSILYGLAGLAGALLSPFIMSLQVMDVRRGLIVGFSFVSFCFAVLTVALRCHLDGMTLGTIMLYQIVMQATVGPLYWIHIAEVAPGVIISISHTTTYLLTLVMTSAGPYLLKTTASDQATFLSLAVVNLGSAVFCYCCVRSTNGLTQGQKQSLYISKYDSHLSSPKYI